MFDTPLAPSPSAPSASVWSEARAAPRRRYGDRDAALLNWRFGAFDAEDLLRAAIEDLFSGRIAVVTSFGTESALLLDMVARVDRHTPVIFLETGKHFPETLDYRDRLISRLRLTDVRSVGPADLSREDPAGDLWRTDPDRCCDLRKVRPLAQALDGFDAWISGRKRYQGGTRETLDPVEADGGRIKVNPLHGWSFGDIRAAFDARGLPDHPLLDFGYLSVGCSPCTEPADADDPRAGRWAGLAKTECGIHGRG